MPKHFNVKNGPHTEATFQYGQFNEVYKKKASLMQKKKEEHYLFKSTCNTSLPSRGGKQQYYKIY